jgi:DNA polymerase
MNSSEDSISLKSKQLQDLYQELESAHQQLPLATQATDIIPGEGHPDAAIMLIGEAPGQHEHEQRRPFVGRSGQFLRQTLTKVEIPVDQVYISNIVKVRPPENRDPTASEITAFRPYLDQEIEIIQPAIIVTLGRFSMAKFLPEVKISQVHGRLHKVIWHDKPTFILPMYHPAAGLRSGQMRAAFEADFAKAPKIVKWVEDQSKNITFEKGVKDALL